MLVTKHLNIIVCIFSPCTKKYAVVWVFESMLLPNFLGHSLSICVSVCKYSLPVPYYLNAHLCAEVLVCMYFCSPLYLVLVRTLVPLMFVCTLVRLCVCSSLQCSDSPFVKFRQVN